jgi:hypothetical protein
VALDFIDCPDRRLIKAATDLAEREVETEGTHVTVILPRRSYSALLGRLLHDRTADKIAAAVSRIPRSAATIVPYDVPSRVAVLQARQAAKVHPGADWMKPATVTKKETGQAANARELARESDVAAAHGLFKKPAAGGTAPGVTPIGAVTGGKTTVEGKIRVVEIRPVERNSVLAVEINDTTGNLTAMFYGRAHIPGLICGARVRLSGSVRLKGGQPVMINPSYELVSLSEEG